MVASQESTEPGGEPLFELYQCTVGEKVAFIRVNVSQHDVGIDEMRPYSLCVSTAFRKPTEDGLVTAEEFEALSRYEDALMAALAPSVFVGVLTNDGQRMWYFYTDDPDRDAELAREVAGRELSGYEVEAESFEDPEWRQYHEFLYPNDLAWQWIQDRRVLVALEQHGDQSDIPRSIDHYAYFPTRRARRAYLKELVKRGYREGDESSSGGEPPNKYGLHFLRSEPEAPADIFPRSEKLLLLAQEHDGVYDGWGCTVVKAEGAESSE